MNDFISGGQKNFFFALPTTQSIKQLKKKKRQISNRDQGNFINMFPLHSFLFVLNKPYKKK